MDANLVRTLAGVGPDSTHKATHSDLESFFFRFAVYLRLSTLDCFMYCVANLLTYGSSAYRASCALATIARHP